CPFPDGRLLPNGPSLQRPLDFARVLARELREAYSLHGLSTGLNRPLNQDLSALLGHERLKLRELATPDDLLVAVANSVPRYSWAVGADEASLQPADVARRPKLHAVLVGARLAHDNASLARPS